MAQTDLAIRKLAQHGLPDMLTVLLRGHDIIIERVEEVKIKLVERLTDSVALATLDGNATVLHVEFEAGYGHAKPLPARVMACNALLRLQFPDRAVRSIVVFLTSHPPGPRIVLDRLVRQPGDLPIDFEYEVFIPCENPIGLDIVARTPGLAPLALLTPGIQIADLADVRRVIERSHIHELPAADLLTLAYVLGEPRFNRDLLDSYLRSEAREASRTYQHILDQGRQEGIEQGRQEGLCRAIAKLVAGRRGRSPRELEARLAAHSEAELYALLDRMTASQDDEGLRASLAGVL